MTQRLLPDDWVETTLSLLGSIQTGKTPSTKVAENFGGDIPFVKPADLDNGGYINTTQDTLTQKGLDAIPKLPPKAIMVTCIGNLGKVGITTQVCATNQQINSVIPNGSVVFYKYLYYCLLSLKNWLDDNSSATTVAIINKTRFSKAPIPLPPLAEQRHIATVLDDSLAMVAQIRERLDSVQQQLKRFRQSVLADAVSGRLTADWRGSERSEIALPDGWVETTLADITTAIAGGGTPSKSKPEYFQGNIPWMTVKDMTDVSIIDTIDHITDEAVENSATRIIPKNTPIVATRMSLGKIVIADFETAINQDLKAIFLKDVITTNFFVYWYRSKANDIISLGSGTTVKGIRLDDLRQLSINLPPLPEQQEIVRRVDALFAHAEQIEQRMTAVITQVERLAQSLLAAAFDGSLSCAWRDANQALITGEHSAAALLAQLATGDSAKGGR